MLYYLLCIPRTGWLLQANRTETRRLPLLDVVDGHRLTETHDSNDVLCSVSVKSACARDDHLVVCTRRHLHNTHDH